MANNTTPSLTKRVFNKILRIIEGPPVRNRVVVKVIDANNRTRCKPCFLIGVYRSGTTLLRYIIDSHSNIAVPPETNFLNSLADLYSSEWVKKGFRGIGADDANLIERLRDFAWNIFDDYAIAKGKARWVDKTPSYIDILEFLDIMFGEECRYIMLYRHGLDVANSLFTVNERDELGGPVKRYSKQYKSSPYLAFVNYWTDQCQKMMEFETRKPNQCFRIDYEQYSRDPETYIPPLFAFLGEPWEPSVLDFNRNQHDFGLQDHKIRETKGFKPKIETYLGRDPDELSKAWEISADVLSRLGYKRK